MRNWLKSTNPVFETQEADVSLRAHPESQK
jgi:hypothetical protein